jgi:hypothetical protein
VGPKAVAFVSWGKLAAHACRATPGWAASSWTWPIRFAVHIPNPWFIKDTTGIDTEGNQQSAKLLLDNLTCGRRAQGGARLASRLSP